MTYTILHPSRNGQRAHVMVDDETTLPSIFLTMYGLNRMSKKRLGTQKNTLESLRFFYVYYYKKYKRTFDFDFYLKKYNIAHFIDELDGFFTYLLGKQHRNNEKDILGLGFFHSAISKNNKVTYGNHVRAVGRFFKYLNYRYLNIRFQDMSLSEAHMISDANCKKLKYKVNEFNNVEVSKSKRANQYKSITGMQNIELNNMLIPSSHEFTDVDTGEVVSAVINPQNPFAEGFQQYRNYIIHRLMYNYGLRVGETLLLTKDCVGPSLPDSRGKIRYIMVVQSLPDDVDDLRKTPPSLKTLHSQRQIELTEDDYAMLSIYIESYRNPLFDKKGLYDHSILFIQGIGGLMPLTYDAIRSFYKSKIDPTFIKLYPYYRSKNKYIDYLVKLTPHVGRHTWAYITLEYIYNKLLKESIAIAADFGISARMNGELDAAVEQLRTLGGWSTTSIMPLMYAERFIELIANNANLSRTKRSDQYTAIPDIKTINEVSECTDNILKGDEYDEFL